MSETSESARRIVDIDVYLVIIFTFATALFIFLPQANATFIRPIFGLVFVLFAPGYALVAALFPNKRSVNYVQRIALSFGLSILVVPLTALCFSYLTAGIRLEPIAGFLCFFVVTCALIAEWRRRTLSYEERFSLNLSTPKIVDKIFANSDSRVDKVLSLALLLSALVLTSTLVFAIANPNPGETFTEFYILGSNGTISGYPVQFRLGEQKPIRVGVVNHEQRDASYSLVVRLNNSSGSKTFFSENVSLGGNQRWEKVLYLKPDRRGSNMEVEFLLYLNNNLAAPYRETHLWITVT